MERITSNAVSVPPGISWVGGASGHFPFNFTAITMKEVWKIKHRYLAREKKKVSPDFLVEKHHSTIKGVGWLWKEVYQLL